MNKTIQDLKIEIETIKKSQRETTLEIENLGKRSGVIDASITNRIHKIEEKIPGAEDTIGNIDTTIKDNSKSQRLLTQYIQEIQDTMKSPNLRIIEESEDFQLKGPVSVFNKIMEKKLSYPIERCPWTYKKPTELQIDWTRKEIPLIT
jgi:cell division protein FtsL